MYSAGLWLPDLSEKQKPHDQGTEPSRVLGFRECGSERRIARSAGSPSQSGVRSDDRRSSGRWFPRPSDDRSCLGTGVRGAAAYVSVANSIEQSHG